MRVSASSASAELFVRRLARMVGRVQQDGDREVAKVLDDQRFHVGPVQAANPRRKFRKCEAGKAFFFDLFAKGAEAVVDRFERGLARMAVVGLGGSLGKEADDPDAFCTAPRPDLARFRAALVAVVPEVFVHRRPVSPQSEGQALVKVIVGGDAVGDRLGFAQKDITAYFTNHRRSFRVEKKSTPMILATLPSALVIQIKPQMPLDQDVEDWSGWLVEGSALPITRLELARSVK